jgi:hypothetical protein
VHCWTFSLNNSPEKHLAVELSNVNFIDENGRALLSCLQRFEDQLREAVSVNEIG